MTRTNRFVLLGVLLAGAAVAAAGVGEPAIRITATNSAGTAVVERTLGDFTYIPATSTYFLSLPAQVLMDGPNAVAELTGMQIFITDDPTKPAKIQMNYGVRAGMDDAGTEFEVTPGVVSFPTVLEEYTAARMGWSFTVTENPDGDGDEDVWLNGIGGNGVYRTFYDGTLFHESVTQVGGTSGGGGQVYNPSENYPDAFNYADIPAPVSNISASFAFTLTKLDTVEFGTSYVFVPEPASFGLLALGMLALVSRRR